MSARVRRESKTPQRELIYVRLGMVITDIRIRRDLTQKQLADETGISRGSIGSIENGRQRIWLHDLQRIASALQVDVVHIVRTALKNDTQP